MRIRHSLLLAAGASLAPAAALACGGLFCNTTQPVNQSAEAFTEGRSKERWIRMAFSRSWLSHRGTATTARQSPIWIDPA